MQGAFYVAAGANTRGRARSSQSGAAPAPAGPAETVAGRRLTARAGPGRLASGSLDSLRDSSRV